MAPPLPLELIAIAVRSLDHINLTLTISNLAGVAANFLGGRRGGSPGNGFVVCKYLGDTSCSANDYGDLPGEVI